MVTGCKIDLQKIPVQHIAARETNFSAKELHFVNDEIEKLLNKKLHLVNMKMISLYLLYF